MCYLAGRALRLQAVEGLHGQYQGDEGRDMARSVGLTSVPIMEDDFA